MRIHHLTPIIFLILNSCAGYSLRTTDGLHYPVYKPQPYILIGPSPDSLKIIYLPDYSKAYEIKSWSFLGKADFEFNIVDGWQLTKISDKSSTEEVPKGLSNLAKEILSMQPKQFSQDKYFELYRIDINDKNGHVTLKKVEFE